MILIFTNENDFSSIEVAKRLRYYEKEFYLINPEEALFKFSKIDSEGIFFNYKPLDKEINLLDVHSCWWRRTGLGMKNFTQSSLIDELEGKIDANVKEILLGEKSVLKYEFLDLKEYIFEKIHTKARINLGHHKMFNLNRLLTLDLANQFGLKTPYYEVVSKSNHVNLSTSLTDKFVTKAISNGLYHTVDNKSYYTYTELQKKSDFADLNIHVFPSLVMNLINKKFEIRSFYLDGNFFSMAIFSQTNEQTQVDFRKYSSTKPNRNEPFQLPKYIEKKLDALFKELGLNTGSVDLIVNENNEYIFLEINPIGQYGMTSEPCNYNLDDLIAKYLINGNIT